MSVYLYLVRHGEQQDAEHGLPDGPLSDRGVKQAEHLADRLANVRFDQAWHSPLQRASETAAIISAKMPSLTFEPSALLLDCIPSAPDEDTPNGFEAFFGGISEAEFAAGSAQMSDAIAEWFVPSSQDKHQLLVTHNFVISWFVREAMGAPNWRWLTLNQANCGITVIRIRASRPHALVTHNDIGHLPPKLRTGMLIDLNF